MTQCTLLPNGRQQFIDANGNPIVGGSVYFYIPGTLTPKSTYKDPLAATLNTNPVLLDSQGTALIYGTGSYRQILVDSLENTIWDALTADTYGLVLSSNNLFTGNNTFAGTTALGPATGVTLSAGDNSVSLATTGFVQKTFAGSSYVTYQSKIRNGNFNIFQRGTSGTVASGTPAYTADGFILSATGASSSWAANGSGFGGSTNGLAVNGAIGLTGLTIKQRIESYISAPLSNSICTFQAAIFNNIGITVTPKLTIREANAPDNWASSTIDVNAVSLQPCQAGSWTVVSYNFTASSLAINGTEATLDFGSSLNGSAISLQSTNWDLRVNSSATAGLNAAPPVPELRPIPSELEFCQRYFFELTQLNNAIIGYGYSNANNAWEIGIPLPVTMRSAPTPAYPAFGNVQANAITATAIGNATVSLPTASIFTLAGAVASGLSAGNAVGLRWLSGGTGSIQLSAEL